MMHFHKNLSWNISAIELPVGAVRKVTDAKYMCFGSEIVSAPYDVSTENFLDLGIDLTLVEIFYYF